MKPSDHRIDGRDWVLLGILSVLWGGSFFFNGIALKRVAAVHAGLSARGARGAGAAAGAAGLSDRFSSRAIGLAAVFRHRAAQQRAAVLADREGQTYIPSGLASILNATTPLFTVLVMAASGDEKLLMRRVAGVLAGLIGVIILHGQDLGFSNSQGIGVLLCLAGAFSYGLSTLYARRNLSNSPPLATATFQLLASSLMMAIVAAVVERPWRLPMPGATTWLAMAGLAGLSTALVFQILRRSGSSNVMLVTLLIPVTAILLGYFVLGESISWREIVGAIGIGSALLLIDGRVLNLVRRPLAVQ